MRPDSIVKLGFSPSLTAEIAAIIKGSMPSRLKKREKSNVKAQ